MAYLQGDLTAEAFLQKIDTTHELENYEAGKAELKTEATTWQKRVASSWTFDRESFYPESIMVLDATPGKKGEWEILTRDELLRQVQEGHQSLREKYRKD